MNHNWNDLTKGVEGNTSIDWISHVGRIVYRAIPVTSAFEPSAVCSSIFDRESFNIFWKSCIQPMLKTWLEYTSLRVLRHQFIFYQKRQISSQFIFTNKNFFTGQQCLWQLKDSSLSFTTDAGKRNLYYKYFCLSLSFLQIIKLCSANNINFAVFAFSSKDFAKGSK